MPLTRCSGCVPIGDTADAFDRAAKLARMRLDISPGVYLSRDELTELEERLTTPSVAQHMAARAVVVGAGVDPFDGDPALDRRLQAAMRSRQHWTTAHRTKL